MLPMQNLKTVFGLLMTSLVLLVPAASALPALDLGAKAGVDVSANVDGALETANGAVAQAHGAVDQAQAAAAELQAQATARAESTLDDAKAEASASASASTSAAQDAIARIQAAFNELASFAGSVFASVDIAARLG